MRFGRRAWQEFVIRLALSRGQRVAEATREGLFMVTVDAAGCLVRTPAPEPAMASILDEWPISVPKGAR